MKTIYIIISIISVYGDDEHQCQYAKTIDESNLDSQIEAHHSALVLFYAPWCGHCKRLMPEYDELCKKIHETHENIICGRVDCTKNEKICREHQLKGYPTIKVMRKNRICEYEGPRQADKIYEFLQKQYKSKDIVTDLETAKNLISENQFALVSYIEPESSTAELINSQSCKINLNSVTFNDPKIAESLKVEKDTVNIFKDSALYKTIEVQDEGDLIRSVLFNVYPVLQEYSAENGPSIFSPHIKYYIAFIYEDDEKKSVIEEAATRMLEKIRFFSLNSKVETNKDIIDHFHVKSLPGVVFYNDETSKFHHYEGELTADEIITWATGVIDNKVAAFVKKQEVPSDWDDGNVKVLVVDNFGTVFEKYQGGLVMFYAPWCGHCKAFMSTLVSLGDWVAETHKDLFVAKLDHTENDIDGVKIEGYPTIIAFKGRDQQIPYTGDRTLDDLKKFFESTFAGKTLESGEEQREEL